jgi:hypothetical protein
VIYNRLLNYHRARRQDPKHPAVRDMLTQIIRWIEEHTGDMATLIVNGRHRYRDYRDWHGLISEFERQARLPLPSTTASTAPRLYQVLSFGHGARSRLIGSMMRVGQGSREAAMRGLPGYVSLRSDRCGIRV